MWTLLGLMLLVLIACFGFVLAFGAPYLPTLTPNMHAALELADLQPGQTLLELGCGDGKVMLAAAQRGIRCIGYELNPLLVIVCRLRCWRYRRLVTIKWGNFWAQDWPPADAIFVFLLQKYMVKLDKKITQYKHKPVKLLSFAFPLPDRDADHHTAGIFLYEYK